MEPAAPHPPTAMETEPTKVSIKTMKEIIRSAGLATAEPLLRVVASPGARAASLARPPTLGDQATGRLPAADSEALLAGVAPSFSGATVH